MPIPSDAVPQSPHAQAVAHTVRDVVSNFKGPTRIVLLHDGNGDLIGQMQVLEDHATPRLSQVLKDWLDETDPSVPTLRLA